MWSARSHPKAPPVGFNDWRKSPSLSPTTQVDGAQPMAVKVCGSPPLRSVVVHAPAPPVGSVEVTTLPSELTAAQSSAEGQDTPSKPSRPLRLVVVQAPMPLAGSTEVRTLPASSTAAQNSVDAQDTPVSWLGLSTGAVDHMPAPPAGSVEVSTLPSSSTATQNDGPVQETPMRPIASDDGPTSMS